MQGPISEPPMAPDTGRLSCSFDRLNAMPCSEAKHLQQGSCPSHSPTSSFFKEANSAGGRPKESMLLDLGLIPRT